ncbi:MAG: DNA-processing protein DprA [Actinomycetota bacterium]
MNRTIRPRDPEWPERLSELAPHEPVKLLFARGRTIDPDAPAVAVVGTRRPSAAGIEAATSIARALGEAGVVVVSGLAVGIDAAAHRAALDAGATTIAVLGCGLDVAYPQRNRALKGAISERGTLVTEYPNGTHPTKAYFPQRNRIIAGLSLGVVVIEGAITSGALVTARLALEANRNVYALPGSIRNPMSQGPNELIRTGRAALVTKPEHIFEDLAPTLVWEPRAESKAPRRVELDELEQSLLAHLDDAPVAPDRLASALDVPPGRMAVALSKMEVRGLVARRPGGYEITGAGARARG